MGREWVYLNNDGEAILQIYPDDIYSLKVNTTYSYDTGSLGGIKDYKPQKDNSMIILTNNEFLLFFDSKAEIYSKISTAVSFNRIRDNRDDAGYKISPLKFSEISKNIFVVMYSTSWSQVSSRIFPKIYISIFKLNTIRTKILKQDSFHFIGSQEVDYSRRDLTLNIIPNQTPNNKFAYLNINMFVIKINLRYVQVSEIFKIEELDLNFNDQSLSFYYGCHSSEKGIFMINSMSRLNFLSIIE